MAALVGAILLAMLLASPALPRQQTDAEYHAIVAAFRRSPNDATEQMLALPLADVDRSIALAIRPEASGGWPMRDLLAAALLHSQAAAYFVVHENGPALEHVTRAQRFVNAVMDRSDAYRWFEREWYGAMIDVIRNRPGRVVIDWQAKARPAPAWDEYVLGVAFERQAGEFASLGSGSSMNHLEESLSAARDKFQRALAHDPRFLDAALHLGRVEMLFGRDDRAAQLFAQATESTRPSTVSLAESFAGALNERRGRFVEAEANYRRAVAAYAGSQSAPLSLAQLLDRTGRSLEAREVIDQMFDRAADHQLADSWLIYFLAGHAGLQVLRLEVSQ